MDDADELVARARAGDGDARRALVERGSLRLARLALGGDAEGRRRVVREVRGPALAIALAAIAAADGDAALHDAIDGAIRDARSDAPVVAACIARHGARLGPELACDAVEWAARQDLLAPVIAGATAALAGASEETIAQLAWRSGFGLVCGHAGPLVAGWAASPIASRAVARAVFDLHARGRSCIDALDALWGSEAWADALAAETAQHAGMSHRASIAAWGWRRFCAAPGERALLYRAFRPWRDAWFELLRAMPAAERPGGGSAIAHLQLWGELDRERLSATVEEAARLATPGDWLAMIDVAFDLVDGSLATLAGACRIAAELTQRIRPRDADRAPYAAAAQRLIERASALAGQLRTSGAVLDPIASHRADDLELEARLAFEALALD
ncbi:MAG TPA: hypothetical protein VLX92_22800, partial [Kofleriaceae bacterium]|nr:hypothetical protein [Kofleriaceae bacterium]